MAIERLVDFRLLLFLSCTMLFLCQFPLKSNFRKKKLRRSSKPIPENSKQEILYDFILGTCQYCLIHTACGLFKCFISSFTTLLVLDGSLSPSSGYYLLQLPCRLNVSTPNYQVCATQSFQSMEILRKV